jgi:act minimal PKS chain-length factor (CLF/KS beta)
VFAVETASERPLARLAASGISATARGAMSAALDAAGVRPDLVVAAAGGYERLDEEEEAALTDLFGTGGVPVTAAKAMFGETLGASGPLNLAVALAAIERGMLPPTAGADARPLGGLDLVCEARPSACRCALVNAAHPDGGVWVSLVVVSPT